MGGQPALGYDVKDRKLVVNEADAKTVWMVFRRYLALGSVRALKTALDAEGIVSKRRTAADGSAYGGQSFSRGALYQMLQNRVYRGEIVHKGTAYPGEHPPIVDEALWSSVQRKLEANGVDRRTSREEAKQAYLFAGVVHDADGESMTPTHAVKKGVRYRYYVSRKLIADVRKGDNQDPGAGQRLPAAELERLIVDRCRTFLSDPQAVVEALPPRCADAPRRKKAMTAARDIARTIGLEQSERTVSLLRSIIVRAQVHLDRIDVDLGVDRLADALLGRGDAIEPWPSSAHPHDRDGDAPVSPPASDRVIRLTIPAELKRAGMEMKFVLSGDDDSAPPDPALVRLLVRANALARRVAAGSGSTLEDAGALEGMGAPYAARLMRLNFLAPEIVMAILNGRQPVGLTASKLMADTRLPLDWTEQRRALGFA